MEVVPYKAWAGRRPAHALRTPKLVYMRAGPKGQPEPKNKL